MVNTIRSVKHAVIFLLIPSFYNLWALLTLIKKIMYRFVPNQENDWLHKR